jgi:hypothetical protein
LPWRQGAVPVDCGGQDSRSVHAVTAIARKIAEDTAQTPLDVGGGPIRTTRQLEDPEVSESLRARAKSIFRFWVA